MRPAETGAIFDGLKGPKTLRLFADVGHDSCLRRRPDEWKSAVSAFLDGVLERLGAKPPAG